uniref:Uncharacterized protein n=1 Tax=Oryza brachyantha TaxID=4533 RepID=J3M191_ORYBR
LGLLARLLDALLDLPLRVPLLLERVPQQEQPQLHLPFPVVLQDLLVRLAHPAETPSAAAGVAVESRGQRPRGPSRRRGPRLDEELVRLHVPIRARPPRRLQTDAVVHGGVGGGGGGGRPVKP